MEAAFPGTWQTHLELAACSENDLNSGIALKRRMRGSGLDHEVPRSKERQTSRLRLRDYGLVIGP